MNANLLILIGRILLSIIFIFAGYGKLMGAEGFAGMLGGMGFPAPLAMAYLVAIFELVGGIAILVGFQTRIAAILLGLFCIATGFMAHAAEMNALLKNIALAGGFFVLAGSGAGAYALDKKAGRVSANV